VVDVLLLAYQVPASIAIAPVAPKTRVLRFMLVLAGLLMFV
jgi:hypothetical protein